MPATDDVMIVHIKFQNAENVASFPGRSHLQYLIAYSIQQGRQKRGGWGGPSRPTFRGKILSL